MKLSLNINLDQERQNPSFVIKREFVGNVRGGRRAGSKRPAQKDECYYEVRVRRLVWNNNFLCHIMFVHF